MSQKFYQAQKIAVAVSAALAMGAANADDGVFGAYEIVNIDASGDNFSVKGSLPFTQNGYGSALLSNGTLLAVSKGVNDGSTAENDNIIDDVGDAILPDAGNSSNAIIRPFAGNNFLFEIGAGDSEPQFVPLLEDKQPILNPSVDPDEDDDDLIANTPRTDAYYYGAGTAITNLRLGVTSAVQQTVANPDADPENASEPDNYYFREFETRAFIQNGDGSAYGLIDPPGGLDYTTTGDNAGTVLNVGGYSVVSGISENGNYLVGIGSVELSQTSKDNLQKCVDEPADDGDRPNDACVQNLKNNGSIVYQNRAIRWDLNASNLTVTDAVELPLGYVPEDDDNAIYASQGLGVNDSGFVVGRGFRSKDGINDKPDLIDGDMWATFWTPSNEIAFVGPSKEDRDEISASILEDVNSANYAVGTVRQYISGFERLKFGYVQLEDVEAGAELQFTQPNDFFDARSDLSSRGRDINNNNQIVGYVEVDRTTQLPRKVHGFIYDIPTDEFKNINELLTCGSRGLFDADGDGNFSQRQVTDSTSFSEEVTYNTKVEVVDASQIDDQGNISAVALVTLPRLKTERVEVFDEDGDSQGFRTVIVTDDAGKPVVEKTANGEYATDQVPRAVILRKTDAESCDVPVITGITPAANERKGAGLGFAWSLLLAPLMWLRRRRS
ncbi:DUF3466 family protein [uncultured Ferrimonas sp.]|uniref:DUF3466 family protein n=1 Tax=uncultured Ferrimonas sp. TaxID=432640 RepID=UPI002618D283|nr:DUF3466 family protein [uncultured Ferrimonas sp.]